MSNAGMNSEAISKPVNSRTTLAVAAAGSLLVLVAGAAYGLLAGWDLAALLTAGSSLLGALVVFLARERGTRSPHPSPLREGEGGLGLQ